MSASISRHQLFTPQVLQCKQHIRLSVIDFEIRRGCDRLLQAGKLANNQLRERLEAAGYYEAAITPGLWKHKWRPILFALIVDDFGIEYVRIEHFNHLHDN